ncbi:hypothetical protein OHW76_12795 [Acinetobacter baumannii]|uniref:hypothetical protein n=1 Tax=Acinetobacter baumannii TaxID=470 RepID=UPI0008103C3E|nr:hypothetical protein [Acinetobacter baumannii]MDC5265965.1 hypothetical protein [Acinetobacter baumannii]
MILILRNKKYELKPSNFSEQVGLTIIIDLIFGILRKPENFNYLHQLLSDSWAFTIIFLAILIVFSLFLNTKKIG